MSERRTRTERGMERVNGRHDARREERVNDFEGDMDAVALYFKERIYATFTGLAIVLVVGSAGHPDARHATLALVLGVLGIVVAGFVADVISHLAVHQHLPSGRDLRILLRISGGALSTVIVPGILVGLAWMGVMDLEAALTASAVVYVATLAVVGWFAVRRSMLVWWKQLVVLAGLVLLALLAVALQILAKSA